MESKVNDALFGTRRSLPSKESIVAECAGLSEREFLRNVGSLASAHLLDIDEGLYIERLTRYDREVQSGGQCLSSASAVFLSVDLERLSERVACRLFVHGDDRLRQETEEARGMFDGAPAPWATSELENRLSASGSATSAERFVEYVEATTDSVIRRDGFAAGAIRAGGLNELAPVIDRGIEMAAAEVSPAGRRVLTAISELFSETCRRGEMRRAAAFAAAGAHLIAEASRLCEERAAEHQRRAGDYRADFRRASFRRETVTPEAPAPERRWFSKITKGLANAFSDFLRDASAPTDDNAEEIAETSPLSRALDSVLRESVTEGVLRRAARDLQLASREVDQLRRQLSAACELGRAKLQRSELWKSKLAVEVAGPSGIQLESDERVIELLAAQLESPSFSEAVAAHAGRVAEIEPARFVDEFERRARQAAQVYVGADLSSVFAQIPEALQNELIGSLLAKSTLPVRKVATAIWAQTFIFAAPGGANGPLGRSLRRHAGAGRFEVRDWSDLANTAVAMVWAPFIRPSEMEAYQEGKEALEQLRARCAEEQLLSLYPFERLAVEADPEISVHRVDELIVEGFAVGQIGASKWPSTPPFYLCNGHTGGRPVHLLKPAIKRSLPRLGSSIAEVRRTLSRRPDLRREIEATWRAEMNEHGTNALVCKVKEALAADVLSTTELRDAASRLTARLVRRG
jgi:hypothetical protein